MPESRRTSNLRPARPEEIALVEDLLAEAWLNSDLERTAATFATVDLARAHVREVKARRLPEIEKVEHEVDARLKKEINYWDARAFELKEQERAGKKTRLNWEHAERRATDLAGRRKRRMVLLDQEKFISALPPRVRGGMIVLPRGLLNARAGAQDGALPPPPGFAEDPAARRKIELAAMEAVMATERELGNAPEDVSARKVGYDIASYDPDTRCHRFIEVKGRVDGADTVMITRQEVITSLHEPEKFILAVVEVHGGFASQPRYVGGALDEREPPFDPERHPVQPEAATGACGGTEMIVGTFFAGDEDTDLMRKQHDVYGDVLNILITTCNRLARFAIVLLNDNEHDNWGQIGNCDHRTLQGAHDLLAAAWRFNNYSRQGMLSFSRTANTAPVEMALARLAAGRDICLD